LVTDAQNANEVKRQNVNMKSARIDLTWTNTGNGPVEADLYVCHHYVKKGDVNDTAVTIKDVTLLQANSANPLYYNDGTNYVATLTPSIFQRGVTLFDIPIKYTGAKVISKTKFLISAGQSITRQFSDSKRRLLVPHVSTPNFTFDNDTTSYVMIFKSVDSLSSSMALKYTKAYRWTQEGVKQPASGYIKQIQP
jgi:hypothetical protein